jgi:hypothetical protein
MALDVATARSEAAMTAPVATMRVVKRRLRGDCFTLNIAMFLSA